MLRKFLLTSFSKDLHISIAKWENGLFFLAINCDISSWLYKMGKKYGNHVMSSICNNL